MEKHTAAVVGYGHLGKEAVKALQNAPDLQAAGVYSRRGKRASEPGDATEFHPLSDLTDSRAEVLLLCGSSAGDLPQWTPFYAAHFAVVDAFDLHTDAAAHFSRADAAARSGCHAAVVCAGWDPGIFSLLRLWGKCFFGSGATETVWGPGVSEGHSAFLRALPGVRDAVCFTLPEGGGYRRRCVLSVEDAADKAETVARITRNTDYFGDCRLQIEFLSPAAFAAIPKALPHGGRVTLRDCAGAVGAFDLRLPSNPAFTASVLVAAARAALRLEASGHYGAFTFADIPPLLFSPTANRFGEL